MELLAKASGAVIYKDEKELIVAHVGGNGLAVTMFVSGLVTFITGAQGIVWLTLGSMEVSAVFFFFALISFAVFHFVFERRKEAIQRPPSDLTQIFRIDFSKQEIQDENGRMLCPVSAARLKLIFQVSSSSRSLALVTPQKEILIARGNPFAGGTASLINELTSHGIAAP